MIQQAPKQVRAHCDIHDKVEDAWLTTTKVGDVYRCSVSGAIMQAVPETLVAAPRYKMVRLQTDAGEQLVQIIDDGRPVVLHGDEYCPNGFARSVFRDRLVPAYSRA
ncbi:hypothetical protein GCM10023221_36500 [Luteimicrobium xylanilyticum]